MLCAVLSMFLASACNDRRPAPTGVPYQIIDDGGGQLISAEADRARLYTWGRPVEISGYCASACVIFTTLPNACIVAGTRIGFHGSNVNMGPIGSKQMARYLRGDARRLYLAEWQFVPPTEMHWMPVADYQKLDPNIRICGA